MNILVTSKSFGKTNPDAWAKLEGRGFQLKRASCSSPTPADIAAEIAGVDALIVGNDTINRTVFDAADRLKLIHMHGTGIDGIDVPCATERGILVANAPGANSNAVAEMTVALMLDVARRVNQHARLLREGRWERIPGREVSGSTVGIVGLGNIGRRVAALLRGFEPELIGYDPMAEAAWAEKAGMRLENTSKAVFRQADFLVLALPLLPGTRHIVNAATLALMKPTAFIVNTARGGLVDDGALCRAIDASRIAGAALDVFAEEPLPMDSPLRKSDVVITPHLAASSIESTARISDIVADHIIAILLDGHKELALNGKQVFG